MPKYKVTDPKGVLVGEVLVPKGDNLPKSAAAGAQLKVWLRFKQVQEVTEPAAKPEKAESPKSAEPPAK